MGCGEVVAAGPRLLQTTAGVAAACGGQLNRGLGKPAGSVVVAAAAQDADGNQGIRIVVGSAD